MIATLAADRTDSLRIPAQKTSYEVITAGNKYKGDLFAQSLEGTIKAFTDEAIKILFKQVQDFKNEEKIFCKLTSSKDESYCLVFHFKKILCSQLTTLLHDRTKIAYNGNNVLFTTVGCNSLSSIVDEILFSITSILTGVVHRWTEFKNKELETYVKITYGGVQYHMSASLAYY